MNSLAHSPLCQIIFMTYEFTEWIKHATMTATFGMSWLLWVYAMLSQIISLALVRVLAGEIVEFAKCTKCMNMQSKQKSNALMRALQFQQVLSKSVLYANVLHHFCSVVCLQNHCRQYRWREIISILSLHSIVSNGKYICCVIVILYSCDFSVCVCVCESMSIRHVFWFKIISGCLSLLSMALYIQSLPIDFFGLTKSSSIPTTITTSTHYHHDHHHRVVIITKPTHTNTKGTEQE